MGAVGIGPPWIRRGSALEFTAAVVDAFAAADYLAVGVKFFTIFVHCFVRN